MPHATVRGAKLYWEEHGGGDAPPLVLVMGLGGSCRGWLPIQVPELSRDRRVIIYDHRGVGGSDDPGGAFTTADLADDLVGLLDTAGIDRADVLGAFLGGMVGQELALRHPDRLRRLVLVGTYARPDAKRRLLLDHWAEAAARGAPADALQRERLLWTLQDETLEQRDLIDTMLSFFEREGLPMSADVFVRQCRACLEHDTYDRLREIRHPTLVLCGRHDQLTPPKLHRELADELPHARLVTLQYGAHLVLAECAERLHHVVRDFLGEHD